MRIGVLADIHGNIDALDALLDRLDDMGVDFLLCAGDVVGYGACPKECIERLQEREIPTVLGNHDHYVTDRDNPMMVRAVAKTAIYWTREQLSDAQTQWLASRPRRIEFHEHLLIHSSNSPSPFWPYVTNEAAAAQNFLFQRHHICFTGHTHVPVFCHHREGESIHLDLLGTSTILPSDGLVLLGVGSVGQPRDADPRAAAVLYDSAENEVDLVRVHYDIATAQKRIRNAGLPAELADRLARGQ